MMLDTAAPCATAGTPGFVVTAHDNLTGFNIDDDAFMNWIAVKSDELARHLPAPGYAPSGPALNEFAYRALSAHVLVGDPRIELNVHGHASGAGYFVQLNNRAGRQRLVGLTRGCHELRRPSNDLTTSNEARYYLQEICHVANALLADLFATRIRKPEKY